MGAMTDANAARKMKKTMTTKPNMDALLRINLDQASCPRLLLGRKTSLNSATLPDAVV
jgi:hypothetical protein